jgi:hypothetical protein
LSVDKIPDEFYDEEKESEKEFLDVATSLHDGGIENLSLLKVLA